MLTRRTLNLLGINMQGDFGPWTCYKRVNQRLVYFAQAPPKTAPSAWQIANRAKWKQYARLWSAIGEEGRKAWHDCAALLNLHVTGWNLFIWHLSKQDQVAIDRIQEQTGITLPGA